MKTPAIRFERQTGTRYPCYVAFVGNDAVGVIEQPTRKSGWCLIEGVESVNPLIISDKHETQWCGSFASAKIVATQIFAKES